MKEALKTSRDHIQRNSPLYFWIPGILLLLFLLIWIVGEMTGRKQFQPGDPSSSADVLIDLGYRCVAIVAALVFTWLVKSQERLNRAVDNNSWQAYAVSRLQTALLVGIFLYVLTH